MYRNGGAETSYSNAKGSTGTGGLLIIYANEILNSGSINSEGSRAMRDELSIDKEWTGATGKATGGASGGGSINIFYKDKLTDTDKASYNVNGGDSNAGKGCVSIGTISSGIYENTKNY